jgi:hypothetical protein
LQEAARERLNEKLSEALVKVPKPTQSLYAPAASQHKAYEGDIALSEQCQQLSPHGTEAKTSQATQADLEAWIKEQSQAKARRNQAQADQSKALQVPEYANTKLQPDQSMQESELRALETAVRRALADLMLVRSPQACGGSSSSSEHRPCLSGGFSKLIGRCKGRGQKQVEAVDPAFFVRQVGISPCTCP